MWLSSRLRSEDQREVETATGKSAEEVLLTAFDLSTECYSLRFNTDPDLVALFGITEAASITRTAVPWMLCTDAVGRGAIAIAREASSWLSRWSHKYGFLRNIVDVRNTLHIRWLQAAGCQFTYHAVWVRGHPFFYFFYQESTSCVNQQPLSASPR